MRILLTGATGFLGSHIADFLCQNGFDLLLTRRTTSKLDKCIAFAKDVNWILTDDEKWIAKAIEFKPEIIIHAAWNGVENSKRDNWEVQLSNIGFLYQLLKIAKEANVKKIIALGSQAEYGQFNEKVTEEYSVNPVSSYGFVKLACLEYLKSFCNDHSIQWYWLRIFSILGKNDNPGWLIPSVITKLNNNETIDLTLGDQCYDYMYVTDFCDRLLKVICSSENNSGIYNVCTGRATKIKELLIAVANKIDKPLSLLKFGALPYRPNQTMFMIGDSAKFDAAFGQCDTLTIKNMIEKSI
jgi:nucleoside-diphosphate-sugar epimerase